MRTRRYILSQVRCTSLTNISSTGVKCNQQVQGIINTKHMHIYTSTPYVTNGAYATGEPGTCTFDIYSYIDTVYSFYVMPGTCGTSLVNAWNSSYAWNVFLVIRARIATLEAKRTQHGFGREQRRIEVQIMGFYKRRRSQNRWCVGRVRGTKLNAHTPNNVAQIDYARARPRTVSWEHFWLNAVGRKGQEEATNINLLTDARERRNLVWWLAGFRYACVGWCVSGLRLVRELVSFNTNNITHQQHSIVERWASWQKTCVVGGGIWGRQMGVRLVVRCAHQEP